MYIACIYHILEISIEYTIYVFQYNFKHNFIASEYLLI